MATMEAEQFFVLACLYMATMGAQQFFALARQWQHLCMATMGVLIQGFKLTAALGFNGILRRDVKAGQAMGII